MPRGLLWLLAATAGITVANLYYNQPLLAEIGRSLQVSPHAVGFLPTASQLGYAAGMLLVVPLGDTLERRGLIVWTSVAAVCALLLVAVSPSLPFLIASSFLLGLATCVPQLVVPFAAGLVPASARGRSVGVVMSGLLVGILLSRTASGFAGERLGWRPVYFIATGLTAALAITLRLALPKQEPRQRVPYRQLLGSLWPLWVKEPRLRRHALLAALTFGCFSIFWTTLVFYLAAEHHGGSAMAGAFGLVGVVGALAAPFVGRIADKRGPSFVSLIAIALVIASFGVFWLCGRWLVGLAVGVVLLDVGAQANHISNQSRVLGLSDELRNRLNTIYMVIYFGCGAGGSALGAWAWAAHGWSGVCSAGALLGTAALAAFFLVGRPEREFEAH